MVGVVKSPEGRQELVLDVSQHVVHLEEVRGMDQRVGLFDHSSQVHTRFDGGQRVRPRNEGPQGQLGHGVDVDIDRSGDLHRHREGERRGLGLRRRRVIVEVRGIGGSASWGGLNHVLPDHGRLDHRRDQRRVEAHGEGVEAAMWGDRSGRSDQGRGGHGRRGRSTHYRVPSCPSTDRWRVASGLGVVTAFIHSSGVLCCTAQRRPLAMAPHREVLWGFRFLLQRASKVEARTFLDRRFPG